MFFVAASSCYRARDKEKIIDQSVCPHHQVATGEHQLYLDTIGWVGDVHTMLECLVLHCYLQPLQVESQGDH